MFKHDLKKEEGISVRQLHVHVRRTDAQGVMSCFISCFHSWDMYLQDM